jgi:membrane protease YdiL (CAAX protease family)
MEYLDYAARGRNAGWRYALALALAFAIAVGAGAIAVVATQLAGVLPTDWVATAQDPGQPVAFFLFNAIVFGLLTCGLALSVRWVQGKRPADLLGCWSWRLFALGGVVWLLALTVAALIDLAIAPSAFRVTATRETLGLVLVALAGLAVQTFAEEYIFRGHITQGLLLAIRKPLPTALVSGCVFGALHVPNGIPQAASATVFGVLLALVAIRTRGIAFTSGLHLVNNLFGAAVVVSAGDVFHGAPGVFSQDTPHLMWWDMGVGSVLLALVTFGVARVPRLRS